MKIEYLDSEGWEESYLNDISSIESNEFIKLDGDSQKIMPEHYKYKYYVHSTGCLYRVERETCDKYSHKIRGEKIMKYKYEFLDNNGNWIEDYCGGSFKSLDANKKIQESFGSGFEYGTSQYR